DDQFGFGKQLGKAPADGDGAYRIRVSPQQEYRNPDLPDALGEILSLIEKPARKVGITLSVRGPPVAGAQARHVDTARRHGEHEMPYQVRLVERRSNRDDASHRLRDQRGWTFDVADDTAHQVGDAANLGF